MSKNKAKIGLLVAASALVLIFGWITASGQAGANRVKSMLVPEKQIVQEVEGQKEQAKVSLKESDKGYILYLDDERYQLTRVEGKDRIVPKQKPEGNYPEVFMEIERVKGKSPSEIAQGLQTELKAKYPEVKNIGQVKEPLPSIVLIGIAGAKWNDAVEHYLLVDDKTGGTIVIRQKYFREAEEGHGARFNNMLREFKLQ